MKYIKLFENKSHEKVFWIIYGNFLEVIEILEKFGVSFMGFDKKYNDLVGIYVGYEPVGGYDYWLIFNSAEFQVGKDSYIESGFKFKGEIKLVDNEIIIDPFIADVENYNL
jgi:hypothetical protein